MIEELRYILLFIVFLLFYTLYRIFEKYKYAIESKLSHITGDKDIGRNITKIIEIGIIIFGFLWVVSILGLQLFLETKIIHVKEVLLRFPKVVIDFTFKFIEGGIALFIGYKLANYSTRFLEKPILGLVKTRLIAKTVLRAIRYSILLLALAIFLYVLGFRGALTSVAAGIGIASVIIGIAAGPIIMSFLSGMFIMGDKPFEIGDFVEIPSFNIAGEVVDVGVRITKIKSTRGNMVIIPNNEIINTSIINYQKEFPYVKIVRSIQISYDSDVSKAKKIILEVLNEDKEVCKGEVFHAGERLDVSPRVFIVEFGDSGINIEFWFWIKGYDLKKEREVVSRTLEKIFKRFKEEGIVIPYPHRVIIQQK